MTNIWVSLLPLAVGSAVVPVQIVITILLLRSPGGRRVALAFVAGMSAVRLLQGLAFGMVLGADAATGDAADGGASPFTAGLLLIVGVVLLTVTARAVAHAPDADEPPARWITVTRDSTPVRAFGLGAGLLLIGPKFWVLTLGAVAVIGDAGGGAASSILLFLLFILLAESVHLTILGVAFAAPRRSGEVLARVSASLEARDRVIVITLGLVFGVWFVLKGLAGLELL